MPSAPKPPPIYVQSTSRPLPLGTHLTLFLAAHRLASKKETSVEVAEDGHTGTVTTTWNSATVADIAGPVFHALLHTEKGEVDVSYIVRSTDLEEALASGAPIMNLGALMGGPTTDPKALN